MYLDRYFVNAIDDMLRTPVKSRDDFNDSGLAATQDGYQITLEVPGVGPGDLTITSQSGLVKISAKSSHGKQYDYSYRLGKTCDESNITANIKNGLLEITIPKRDEVKPREIRVLSS